MGFGWRQLRSEINYFITIFHLCNMTLYIDSAAKHITHTGLGLLMSLHVHLQETFAGQLSLIFVGTNIIKLSNQRYFLSIKNLKNV